MPSGYGRSPDVTGRVSRMTADRHPVALHRPPVRAVGAGACCWRCRGWWRCSTSSSCCAAPPAMPDATLRHRQPDRRAAPALRGDADPAVRRAAGRHPVLLAPDPVLRADRGPRRRRFGVGVPGGADLVRPAVRRHRHRAGQPGLVGDAGSSRGDGEYLSAQRRRPAGVERRPALAAPVRPGAGAAGRRHHPCPRRRAARQAADRAGRSACSAWTAPTGC